MFDQGLLCPSDMRYIYDEVDNITCLVPVFCPESQISDLYSGCHNYVPSFHL